MIRSSYLAWKELGANYNEVVGSSGKVDDKNLFKPKKSKNAKFEI